MPEANPELTVHADDAATLSQGARAIEMQGPSVRPIVWAYRHLAERHGEAAAALYVWGLVDGMRYAASDMFKGISEVLERAEARRAGPKPH